MSQAASYAFSRRLPFGAMTALIGVVAVRGGIIPGLSGLDNSAQILAYAVLLGYAQQLATGFLDRRASSLTDATEVQQANDTSSTPPPPPVPPGQPATKQHPPGESPISATVRLQVGQGTINLIPAPALPIDEPTPDMSRNRVNEAPTATDETVSAERSGDPVEQPIVVSVTVTGSLASPKVPGHEATPAAEK